MWKIYIMYIFSKAAAAAKSLQLCPTLCDPTDGSSPGSPVPGILQARTLEWVAISFSNAWKWKVKGKSLSRVRLQRPHGLQPTRLLHPWDFPGKSTGVGCHCLLHLSNLGHSKSLRGFPGGPMTGTPCSQCRDPGWISDQGNRSHTCSEDGRSHILQLRCGTAK